RFRKGIFGVGGDLTAVDGEKGVAYLKVVEVARRGGDGEGRLSPNAVRKVIVNAPLDREVREEEARRAKPIQGLKVQGAHTIVGPYVEPVKGTGGSVATIKVQEGMWEERRGQKVDGGERRKVQVRRKRKLEEMKKSRA
ncbi:MAG: hypothetical protein Q9194_005736, partial [Teloschistes cf. exilis]